MWTWRSPRTSSAVTSASAGAGAPCSRSSGGTNGSPSASNTASSLSASGSGSSGASHSALPVARRSSLPKLSSDAAITSTGRPSVVTATAVGPCRSTTATTSGSSESRSSAERSRTTTASRCESSAPRRGSPAGTPSSAAASSLLQRARPAQEQPAATPAPPLASAPHELGRQPLAELGHLRQLARLDELAQTRLDTRAHACDLARAAVADERRHGDGKGADPLGGAPVRADRIAGRSGRIEQRRELLQRCRQLLVVGSGHVQSLPGHTLSACPQSSSPTAPTRSGASRLDSRGRGRGDARRRRRGVQRGRQDARRDCRHRRRAAGRRARPRPRRRPGRRGRRRARRGRGARARRQRGRAAGDAGGASPTGGGRSCARRLARTGRRTRSRCPIPRCSCRSTGLAARPASWRWRAFASLDLPELADDVDSAADLERVAPLAGPRTRAVLALR